MVAWDFGIQKVILKVLLKIREWLWRGGGWRCDCLDIGQHHFWFIFLSFHLYIDVGKLLSGWWVQLDYNVSSGPFFTMNFEFDQDHGPRPGPELDKNMQIWSEISRGTAKYL